MSLITWSDKLAVGNAEIDSQHQKLVQLINGLHNHMIAGDAHDVMGKVLERMIEYTAFHFSTEERLMAQSGYPASAAHIAEHRKLVAKATELNEKFRAGKTAITMETMTFLRDWLQHHIAESDHALGAFLAKRNAA